MKPTKTIVITGGNSGLGYESAKYIARSLEWHVVIASRNEKNPARDRRRCRGS